MSSKTETRKSVQWYKKKQNVLRKQNTVSKIERSNKKLAHRTLSKSRVTCVRLQNSLTTQVRSPLYSLQSRIIRGSPAAPASATRPDPRGAKGAGRRRRWTRGRKAEAERGGLAVETGPGTRRLAATPCHLGNDLLTLLLGL